MVFVLSGPLLTSWLFSNTFDKVWHAGLLHKLKAYSAVGPIIRILASFLPERSLEVVIDGQTAPLYITNAGVPLICKQLHD